MMVQALIIGIVAAPPLAIVVCLALRRRAVAEFANLASAVVVFACAAPIPFLLNGASLYLAGRYIVVDPLGAWVVLCTAIVYLLSSIYAVGYMRMVDEDERLFQFYALFAGFALTTLVGPLMNNVGLFWIAIELTTLVSTFLVAFERAAESMEAAWKYIMIVSAGISLALLATILFYWAGTLVLGPSYDMTWDVLGGAAARMNPGLLILAFLLALVGYGTKVGLAPMHSWLPDAHSESPAPVSALLSGALLNTAMVGIVRFFHITRQAALGPVPQLALMALGVLSLLIAALFIVRQRGVKRLMAYSSIEHMGVMALGFGFGGVFGVAGALYHMLGHALNKSLMFFGAGAVMRGYGVKDMDRIRGVGRAYPRLGGLWLAGAVAITGAPPFALFLSEFTILRGGLSTRFAWAAAAMLGLLIVIFIGFLNHFRAMFWEKGDPPSSAPRLSLWMTAPMALALAPLLILGLWWPHGIWTYLAAIAQTLSSRGD